MEVIIIILLGILLLGLTLFFIWDKSQEKNKWEKQGKDLARTVGEQIADTTKVFGEVNKSLGELKQQTQQVQEVGKNIASLQEILRAPKPRGGLGELFLERLLADSLPINYYELQYKFRNGETVDAVVRIGENLVPVDSKFPIEDFERVVKAETKEEQLSLQWQFIRTVKKHIEDVAKYILPDEKTFDFALMYVPAENIYYETMCQSDIHACCMQKKVFLVSPNSFNAYLQVIVLGLRGLQIEKTARDILGYLGRLQGDLKGFQEDYNTLGKHLRNATAKYGDAERELDRFSEKLQLASEARVDKLSEGGTKASEVNNLIK